MNIREDLKAWLDGELSPDRAEAVRAAVEADPALQQEIEFMKLLSSEIGAGAAQAEVKGAEKALEKIKGRRRFAPVWGWAAGVFGIVLVASMIAPKFGGSDQASGTGGSPAGGAALSKEASGMGGKEEAAADAPAASAPGFAAESPPIQSRDGNATNYVAPSITNRSIIRTANLGLRVEDVSKAQDEAHRIVSSVGGFVTSSHSSGHQNALPVADSVLRVPVNHFESTIVRLKKLGEVLESSTSGEDVTAQVADVKARLKVMRAEEESYVTMLRAARKVGELLEIKERLSGVRQQIESLEAQGAALKDLSSLSTINLRFETKPKIGQPEAPKDWSSESYTSAVNTLKDAGRFLGQGVIFLFVFSPIWLPVAILVWWLARRAKRA